MSDGVDLIMANATAPLQAAASATNSIPVLGTSITEYGVALGIENFSGTVGANVSGTSDLAPLDQQAQMIQEWYPDAKTVGLIYCSAEPNSQYQVDNVQKKLEELGLELTYAERKRVHHLKYYTWVEQQGKDMHDLNALWYDTEGTWDAVHAQARDLDELINAFNEETGVLKNL